MAGQGKGPLRIALENFFETSTIWGYLGGWFIKAIEWFEDVILAVFSPILDLIPTLPNVPDDLQPKNMLSEMGKHQGGIATLMGFGVNMGMSAASGLMSPVMRALNYEIDERFQTARFDPLVAFAAMRRVPGMAEQWTKELYGLGWDDEQIGGWFELSKALISEGDLLSLWLRGEVTENALDQELTARAWTTERIEYLKTLRQIIPGVNDLISMAVREAWRDEIAERFGYDEDYPGEVVQWVEKQGLSDEWFRRYWRAHWVLPGVGQGFEMLHRLRPGTTDNPFTVEDMRTMLRTADIPSAFREWLIEISYSPYTRVDTRRMWRMGVLTEDEVKANYLDLGYDEEHADKLTQFTIWEETGPERNLTRSAIERAYKKSAMNRSNALDSLLEIGIRLEDAELYLSLVDLDIAEDKATERIERARFLFVEGELDTQGVYVELGDLDLSAEQLADLIHRWEIERRKKVALPTKSELEDLYERDIISLDDLKEGLRRRRYGPETIEWYTLRLDQRIAEQAAKEAERAQKEQERIEKADYATTYQRTKAGMDVEIAAIKLQIADIKLAMNYMIEVDAIQEAKTVLDILRRDIADWQLAKSEIKVEFLGEGEEG